MKRSISIGVSALTFVAALSGGVASATGTPSLSAEPPPQDSGDTVTVQRFLPDDRTLTSSQTFGADTEGLLMGAAANDGGGSSGVLQPLATGSGGSSSASGCLRVTVNNHKNTALGFTAFIFHTWTHWCWTRSSQNVYDVQHGWTISDVDSQYKWDGIVNTEFGFYDYSTNDGHPRSAYKNYQQGHFEDCILQFGCIGDIYPANTLRSYYNGTWAWTADN